MADVLVQIDDLTARLGNRPAELGINTNGDRTNPLRNEQDAYSAAGDSSSVPSGLSRLARGRGREGDNDGTEENFGGGGSGSGTGGRERRDDSDEDDGDDDGDKDGDGKTTTGATAKQTSPSSGRRMTFVIHGHGIDREVITTDLSRYLGPDALIKPGTYKVRISAIQSKTNI